MKRLQILAGKTTIPSSSMEIHWMYLEKNLILEISKKAIEIKGLNVTYFTISYIQNSEKLLTDMII